MGQVSDCDKYKTIEARFKAYNNRRSTIRAKVAEYAHYTLPWIFPDSEGRTGSADEELTQAAGSIGARVVNHLSNKLASALFIPNRAFFKLEVDTLGYAEAEETLGLDKATVDSALAMIETAATKRLDSAQHRTQAVLAIKNLIITGNALLKYEESRVHVYNFHDYVLKRNMNGETVEIVIEEKVHTSVLTEEVCALLEKNGNKPQKDHKEVCLYTRLYRQHKQDNNPEDYVWKVQQEVGGIEIDVDNGREAQYKPEDFPWITLTWNLVRGEDYGRGLVEDYAYSFFAHEVLSASQMKMFAIMSDKKFFVEPGVLPTPDDLKTIVESASGSWHELPRDSVWTMEMATTDVAIIDTKVQALERELAQAFLLNSAAVRDAERVTAEEIRMQIQELETSYGGIYSRLSTEWQNPLCKLLLSLERSVDALALLKADGISLAIVTGIDSMSRAADLDNVRIMLSDMTAVGAMPPQVLERLKLSALWQFMAACRGIDPSKFIKTDEEYTQEVAQAEQAELQRQQELATTQAQAGAAASLATTM